jgi:hypothetical protein
VFRALRSSLRPKVGRITRIGAVPLREISKRPDGYPADELLAALGGITGSVLGGNLSSVGFGRTYFPEYVWAYTRQNGIYLMPSEAAKIIQQRGL